jgi:serine/threonine protein kinase
MIAATPIGADKASPAENEALARGTVLLSDQFTILRPLSNGGFGITYLARDNYLERKVVIKECFPQVFCRRDGKRVVPRSQGYLSKHRTVVDMFIREARSIAKLRHPNIVGVHRIFEDNDTAYMALDLIDGHDLLHVARGKGSKLSPAELTDILIKLLDAIDLVHRQDLLHRDISPDNILLDKWGSPVLIDFGAAREEASRETRMLSTMLIVKDGYSPQEFYFAGGAQSPASDLYALAATFYHVITGAAPVNSQTRMADYAANNPDPCPPLAGRFDEYDPDFLAAIDKAMHVVPQQRIQSARAWLEIIAPARPEPAARPAPMSDILGQRLAQLVHETNDYVRNSQPVPQADPKPAPAQAPAAKVPDTPPARKRRRLLSAIRDRLRGTQA